ncbi:MAG TPA: emopamil-binding family protein [Spirochaetota bacterium]|nr:DUF2781 domain-containing protein [Spirochaetota bacterium]HOD16875.1 emopamil-binding family protein [Spirochaetota bacterium]HPG50352.1 emopamil-binding family protein [Spirochaetota bacterium]HPN10676.1 emopamil-binding family protein [Spirochaetota bacterium]
MSDTNVLPLRERKGDWLFIAFFSCFVFTSFAADLVNGLMNPSPDIGYVMARAVYHLYAVNNDPLLIANPSWMRAMCFISAFLFGPFYMVLVYSFVKGRNWIRPFALVYAGMIIESMLVILYAEYAGDSALFTQMCQGGVKAADELARAGLNPDLTVQDTFKFLAYNLPYKLVPLMLAIRMRKENPFNRKF